MKSSASVVSIIFALTFISLQIQDCLGSEVSRKLQEISEMCRDTHSTPHEMIEKLRSGNFNRDDIEREAMCHIKCMMEGFGVLENGGLSERVFVNKLGPHIGDSKAHELFDFCKDETGNDDADECDRPFKIFLCLKNLSDIFKY